MAISEEQLQSFRKSIDSAKRILVFFDDDTDGLASYLQVHAYKGDAIGVAVRAVPELREDYLRKVEEHHPDLILVFDMAKISKEFLEKVQVPLIWVDHHEPQAHGNALYLNPRLEDDADNRPTSYWIYQTLRSSLWLATIGCIADWFWPEFIGEFQAQYPELLPVSIQTAPEALFNSKVGMLVQVFIFNLKGTVSDMNKSIRTLAKIKTPLEILNQSSKEGKSLYERYSKYRKDYERLLHSAPVPDEPFVVFLYENHDNAYSSEISNELMYRYQDKVFLIGRKAGDEVRGSLRAMKLDVWTPLQTALKGIEGYGGGHKNACGLCVKQKDFDRFLDALRNAIKAKSSAS